MSSTSYEVRGANALIRLDYPPVNGLGAALRQGLMQALDRALADGAVKAIVVTGSERSSACIRPWRKAAPSPLTGG